jgi:hypothetical protein
MKIEDKKDRPLLEASLENIEVFLDTFINEEVLKDIPILGTAVKLLRASDTIRDKLFAEKIYSFLHEIHKFSQSDIEKMRKKSADSPHESVKIGNTLLMVLDKVSDLDKPKLLGQLFIAYLDNVISVDDFRRLIHAVDVAFVDDLLELIRSSPSDPFGSHLEFLVSSGLSCVVTGGWDQMGENSTGVSYEKTKLANKLLIAYCHVNGIPISPLYW